VSGRGIGRGILEGFEAGAVLADLIELGSVDVTIFGFHFPQ
jgi:hypothetical protein